MAALAIVFAPAHRVAGRASSVVRAFVGTVGRRRRVLRGTAIDLDHGVTYRFARASVVLGDGADGEDPVIGTVRFEVRNRRADGSSHAPADHPTGIQDDGAEHARTRTSKGIGHCGAETKTGREDARLVDAEIALDLFQNVIGEGEVRGTLTPTLADPVRCNENGGALCESMSP